jgi:hypothetical protein
VHKFAVSLEVTLSLKKRLYFNVKFIITCLKRVLNILRGGIKVNRIRQKAAGLVNRKT